MDRESLLRRFDRLNVWGRGDQRAPHKPLLVLYALGRWSRGDRGDIAFRDADRDLTPLLKEFGPPRRSYHSQARAHKMVEIGLIPSDTGEPGGKRTSQSISHYIDPDVRFMAAFKKMPADGIVRHGPTTWSGIGKKHLVNLHGHWMVFQLK